MSRGSKADAAPTGRLVTMMSWGSSPTEQATPHRGIGRPDAVVDSKELFRHGDLLKQQHPPRNAAFPGAFVRLASAEKA
jgi:hypothetical protein